MYSNKILGYILLTLGLILIGWTLWQSYNIFTAKTSAPLVFMNSSIEKPSQKNTNPLDIQNQIQSQIQNAVSSQIGQMIPPDTIAKILNLFSWSILAGIFILGGGAVSGIGIKLMKT
ncbi:MAG: hypothetical protein AAB352_01865 [Patescibacteria group bacterium]